MCRVFELPTNALLLMQESEGKKKEKEGKRERKGSTHGRVMTLRKDLFEAEFFFDFRGIVVIEKEFLTGGDETRSKETDAKISADFHQFGEAVWTR